MRKLSLLIPLAVMAGLFIAAAPARADAGGCQLDGSAAFAAPGLSNTAGPFSYSFSGNLANCQSTAAGAPATGTVEAGKTYTAAGVTYQEPTPTGNGSCASGTTSGTAIITWADATQTVIQYSTTSAGAAVQLTGSVQPSLTLTSGTSSTTITTTRYAGAQALALLAFQADPTQCAGSGVTSAGIHGASTLHT